MKYIFIILLGLITFQVNAQTTKIIGSTTTAGGDLEGTYPNPRIKQNIINRANLTQGLRDSLTRFRHDTTIYHSIDGNLSLTNKIDTLGKYNRVYVVVLGETGFTQGVIMPFASDTIRNTEFNITYIAEDSTSYCQIAAFDGYALFYFSGVLQDGGIVVRSLTHGKTATLKPIFRGGIWLWLSSVSRDIYSDAYYSGSGGSGITALTGDGTATGPGSAVFTISPNAVTTGKILDGTVSLADHASNSVNSSKIVDASVALADMASNSVDNTKIVDYSITGTDLNYLTLRAGDATNPLMRWTNGTVLTTPVNGTWEWDANKLNFTIGGVRKRIGVFTDAAPTGGQLMIGNGTDFTLANLTAGYAQTVTNGSGSITVNPDTTKVIPFIPNAEISNGTRNGYYWNRTSGNFGHQFYRQGYRIFNNSTGAASSAATGLSVSKSGYGASVSLSMTTLAPSIDFSAYTSGFGGAGSLNVATRGTSVRGFITEIGTNVPSGASFQIDGTTSLEYITDNAVTTALLPEVISIASTALAGANQVAPGYRLTVVLDTGGSVTFDAAGSDVIYVHNTAGFAGTYVNAGTNPRMVELVAIAVGTWMIKP